MTSNQKEAAHFFPTPTTDGARTRHEAYHHSFSGREVSEATRPFSSPGTHTRDPGKQVSKSRTNPGRALDQPHAAQGEPKGNFSVGMCLDREGGGSRRKAVHDHATDSEDFLEKEALITWRFIGLNFLPLRAFDERALTCAWPSCRERSDGDGWFLIVFVVDGRLKFEDDWSEMTVF